MRNKGLLVMVCLSILISLWAGMASAGKVTIRWSTWLAMDQLDEYKRIIDLFEKENPNIEVKIESYAGTDYVAKLLTMFAAGVAPDVLHTGVDQADRFIDMGMFYNVAPLMKESGFRWEDYVPFAPIYKRGDKVWGGLESHFQVYPLYYNADFFDEAALPSPNDYYQQGKWDWKTFLEVAKKLTKDTNADGKIDRYGYYAYPGWETGWYPWLLLNNASFIDREFNKITIDCAEAIRALDFYIGLTWKDGVAPKPGAISFTGDPLVAGVTAMYLGGSWLLNHYQQFAQFDWDVAHPPKGVRYATYRSPGANGLVSSQTKHPKEAWKLVEFFLGEKAQMFNARSRIIQPVLLKALLSKEYMRTPPKHMRVMGEMINYSEPIPLFEGFPQVIGAIHRELTPAFDGQKAIEVAVKQAAMIGSAELAKFRKKK